MPECSEPLIRIGEYGKAGISPRCPEGNHPRLPFQVTRVFIALGPVRLWAVSVPALIACDGLEQRVRNRRFILCSPKVLNSIMATAPVSYPGSVDAVQIAPLGNWFVESHVNSVMAPR